MKTLALAFLILTTTAHARQYIQCADYETDDRAVINLNGSKSTLFLTSGVHHDDEIRVLKPLKFVKNDGKIAVYATEGEIREEVKIPANMINVSSRSFEVILSIRGIEFPMGCFSAIYED